MVGHPEGLSVIRERQTGGRNKILCGKSGFRQVRPGKMKLFLPVWMELAVKELQAFQSIKWFCLGSQGFEIRQHVGLDPLQAHLRGAEVVSLNAEGDVFPLGKTVVAFLELAL